MQSLIELKDFINKQIKDLPLPEKPVNLYEPFRYIMELGGKRIRPAMLILAGKAFHGTESELRDAALAIEIFHNFSLVHDDIMDEAPKRRGKETVHIKWDTNLAILTGDVMLVEAYKYLGRLFEKPDSVYCYRKAPYSTNKKLIYKAYLLFHKNFIVTSLQKPLIFPPNDLKKTNMNDEEYKKSLLQNLNQNSTLGPGEQHPFQFEDDNVNNSNEFYAFDDKNIQPRPFQLEAKSKRLLSQQTNQKSNGLL